jgi:hypothetical protein
VEPTPLARNHQEPTGIPASEPGSTDFHFPGARSSWYPSTRLKSSASVLFSTFPSFLPNLPGQPHDLLDNVTGPHQSSPPATHWFLFFRSFCILQPLARRRPPSSHPKRNFPLNHPDDLPKLSRLVIRRHHSFPRHATIVLRARLEANTFQFVSHRVAQRTTFDSHSSISLFSSPTKRFRSSP